MAAGVPSGIGPVGPRFLLCSPHPEVAEALAAAVDGLPATDETRADLDATAGAPSVRLVILDLTGEGVSVREAREALGDAARLVALADTRSVDRLVDALAAGCCDYLFYPLNRNELRLIWRKHVEGEMAPALPLDRVEDGRFHLVFPSRVRYLQPVVARVVDACREASGLEAEAAFRLRVGLGEALANAVLYGSREDTDARVSVAAELDAGELRVTVADEGRGFDPDAVPDPSRQENLDRSRGRGLFLLRRLMDRVEFNEVGNRVTLALRVGHRTTSGARPGAGTSGAGTSGTGG